MKLTIPSLLALVTIPVIGEVAEQLDSDQLVIETSTGIFTGIIDPEFPNTRQFRSIPFAKPPVQSLRWSPPEKLSPSSEHRDATRFPPSCPQFVSAVPSFWNSDFTKGNLINNGAQNDSFWDPTWEGPIYSGNQSDLTGQVGAATSEDCLYLAVWTPKDTAPRPEAGFPVLFFMTGGGFAEGGVDIPWQMPTSWVERSQSHIVITINYRLGIFGFPNARGLVDQNLGILDQRAALEWTRDNIAAFGGDPSRITQMGRSAGAASVDVHSYAFAEDPIAQAYYLQSGTVFSIRFKPDPTNSNFTFVARHFGCGSSDTEVGDGAAELDCFRQVSFKDIINYIGQYTDQGESPALAFSLAPDDRTVFTSEGYKERSEAGRIARLPIIISNTANEVGSLLPPEDVEVGPDEALITALNLDIWICPAYNSTVYRTRMGVPVYRWQHAGTFPNLNVYPWLGAYHASDIPIFFGTYHHLDHIAPSTQFEADVSISMQDHLLAFVKDPHNGPQNTMGWKPMVSGESNGGDLIRFGAGGIVAQHVDGIEVDGACMGVQEYESFP